MEQANNKTRRIQRSTLLGLVWNIVLSGCKLAGGLIGRSQSLIADAVHSLSDCTTDAAMLIGVHYWEAPADSKHPHGHGRIETIVSFFIGVALASVGIGLVYHSIATMQKEHVSVPGWTAFFAACGSILVKEGLYRYTRRVGKEVKSSAMIANAWHHRSDALSSIPVAVAVLATKINPDLMFLDHVAAVLVAVLVLKASWSICSDAFGTLIDAGASRELIEKIGETVSSTPFVKDFHGIRTRNIGTGFQVDLHILVEPEMSVRQGHEVSMNVKKRLLKSDNIVDVLVHIEPNENCFRKKRQI